MVPGISLQSAGWFPKLFTKGREISHLDDLTRKGKGALGSQNLVSSFLRRLNRRSKKLFISDPLDFRQVSGIIEVDSKPPWRRRILLVRGPSNSRDVTSTRPCPPIGFYIREGVSLQVRPDSLDKVPGIFVSRIIPGSLADESGLIAVDDQILDINGVPLDGKTLDEVTELLTPSNTGVVITLKPAGRNLFDRASRPSRQSLSAPTPRRRIDRSHSQPLRPQTPLFITKTAEIRYAQDELHELEDFDKFIEPASPVLITKKAQIQYEHDELHETQDIEHIAPCKITILVRGPDADEFDSTL